jgi:serine/threonine-protein phosphatase 6 regulatory ankyrin repeat subunit B
LTPPASIADQGRHNAGGGKQVTVFIGSPGDMAAERQVAKQVVETLANDERTSHRIKPFLWEYDFDNQLNATAGPQEQLQHRLSAADVLVCVLGERLGTPIPDEFAVVPELPLQKLEHPVVHPWPQTPDTATMNAVPLTGTVYEFLFGRATRKPTLVFLKGDETALHHGKPAHQRNLGHYTLYAAMLGSRRKLSRDEDEDYERQKSWVCRFVDAYEGRRAHFVLFDDAKDFARKLSERLATELRLRHGRISERGKGLAHYDVGDSIQFYGRGEEVRALLDRLHSDVPPALAAAARGKLLVIHGPSGIGKSSFLRAGLGVSLLEGTRPGIPKHAVCVLQPTDLADPTKPPFIALAERLARAIREAHGWSPAWTESDLVRWQGYPHPGEEVAARLRPNAAGSAIVPTMIAIDQFEQLLSQVDLTTQSLDRWRPLLDVLGVIARQQGGLAVISVTEEWRSALYDEAHLEPVRTALGLTRDTARFQLAAPDRTRTGVIIRGFFDVRAVPLADDLLDNLLDQIDTLRSGQGSFLPLLSLLLTHLYDVWRSRTHAETKSGLSAGAAGHATGAPPTDSAANHGTPQLDMQHFADEAKLARVINDVAEAAYLEFQRGRPGGWPLQSALATILRRLVSISATSRRRALRSEPEAAFTPLQSELLRVLQEARLTERSGGRWLIVHETLIEHWDRARQWYDEERVDAVIADTLREDAQRWEAYKRRERYLLDSDWVLDREDLGVHVALTDIERVLGRWLDDLGEPTRTFVEESLIRNAPREPTLDPQGASRLAWIATSSVPRLIAHYVEQLGFDVNLESGEMRRAPLHMACFRDAVEAVELLISLGAEVNTVDSMQWSPLLTACYNGYTDICLSLLRNGADARVPCVGGVRALDCAAEAGHIGVVTRLLEHDAGLLDLPGFEGRTALWAAAAHNQGEVARCLLDRGADPAQPAANGSRALDAGADCGAIGIVQMLIERNPRLLDLPGADDRTALIAAANAGHAELVAWLLQHGADPAKRAAGGTHALDCAALNGHLAVVRALVEHDATLINLPGFAGRTALIVAATKGHDEAAAWLLEHGADVLLHTDNGARALDMAAEGGRLALVQMMLERDATLLDMPGYVGRTALYAAVCGGHAELVKRLLERGADPAKRCDNGARALDTVAELGNLSMVRLLIERDAALTDLPGWEDRTALVAAVVAGHAEVARWLLDQGADPAKPAGNGTRPLDAAAERGYLGIVQLLVMHQRALLNLKGFQECTPLMRAVAAGHVEIARWLLDQGADATQRALRGVRPLDLAAEAGRLEIMQVLHEHNPALLNLLGGGDQSALINATANNQAGSVTWLLARGADPAQRAGNGTRALDGAAERGHLGIVQLLVNHDRVLLNLGGFRDRTALMAAAANGHVEVVRWLLDQGADAKRRADIGARALDLAAETGHLEIVRALIERNPALLDLPGVADRTALMAAVENGHIDVVSWLLDRRADATRGDKEGFRALDFAAKNGHLEIVRLLAQRNPALLALPHPRGITPLMIAAVFGHPSLVKWFLDRGSDPSLRVEGFGRALDGAAEKGALEVIHVLLEHDAGLLELPGLNGRTALSAAARNGHVAVVRWLLDRGAAPAQRDDDDAHALYLAANNGHLPVVQLLLERNPAMIDLPGIKGGTTLLSAAVGGHLEVVAWLLDHGADPAKCAAQGMRPLDVAAGEGHLAVVQRLLERDPGQLDLPGSVGWTALMMAAGYGHADLVRWLLQRGADARVRAENGSRALDAAADAGHLAVVQLLVQHDAGLINLPGEKNRTALACAKREKHPEVVAWLKSQGAR